MEGIKLKNLPSVALVCCVLLFVFLSGCITFGSPDDKSHTGPPGGNTMTPTSTPAPTPTPTPAPEPERIMASGPAGTQLVKVHLEKGLAIFTTNHPGSGHCEIWFSDKVKKIDRLVSTSTGYWGSKAEVIPATDDYYLEVSSGDVWSVQITQPRPHEAQIAPMLSGTGDQVTDYFYLDPGLTTFRITHDGWINFEVWLYDSYGTRKERLVSTYGAYDSSSTVNITSCGIYVLGIQADGQWTVEVSQ